MKNVCYLLLMTFMFCSNSYGQTDFSETTRNNAFLELGGNGGLYSINFDRIIAPHFAVRVGLAS